jgi:hypothetical protein
MTPDQAAAFVAAQTAQMLVELEAMKAANRSRERVGSSDAYGEDEFTALMDRYPACSHNGAMTIFNEANSR